MAVSFIGAAAAGSTSVSVPAHNAGDLILAWVTNGSSVFPVAPTGWAVFAKNQIDSICFVAAYKIAASGSETSGTWTNAQTIAVSIYRGSTATIVVPGVFNSNGGTSTGIGGSVLYGVITADSVVTDKWHCGVAVHRFTDTDINTAPSGMTNRTSAIGSARTEIAIHDTNATSLSWPSTTYTLTAGTTGAYRAIVFEICEMSVTAAGTSASRMVNIRGGADQ